MWRLIILEILLHVAKLGKGVNIFILNHISNDIITAISVSWETIHSIAVMNSITHLG